MSEHFTISGSDNKESALTKQLADAGCTIFIGQNAGNIDSSIDAAVYTEAIHPDNPEYAKHLLAAYNEVIYPFRTPFSIIV